MAASVEQKTEIKNPYSNLEQVFGGYVKYIEQQLKFEPPEAEKAIFEKSYVVQTLQDWDEKKASEYEYGNRIIAPDSTFKALLSKGAETPIILQILNPDLPSKISHCSVIQWTAPNDIIYVPSWMMRDFCLQTTSKKQPHLILRYYEKPFLKGSFIQIQPYKLASIQSDEFKDVQKLFELSLKKYQCLTIGDTLRIQHNQNVHSFEITDVLSAQSLASITPFNVVSIINTDISVDFLPPKDVPINDNHNDNRVHGYDVNIDPKSIPNPNDIIQTTQSSDKYADKQQTDNYHINNNQMEKPNLNPPDDIKAEDSFTGTGHKLDDTTADKKKEVESFANIKGEKIICDENQKTTRIQIILIGNKKEAIKVNLTTTIKQLYQHAKFISGHDKEFQLLSGFPPKPLTNPNATVEEEKLSGARIQQKAL